VGGDLAETIAQARLDLVCPILERDERLVALALDRRTQLREALLDALCRRVGQHVEAPGEHALGFACKPFHREVELARQPSGRLFARRLDRTVERQRSGLRVARRLARDDSLELLDLAALDVAERE